jgi:hypothetical protein
MADGSALRGLRLGLAWRRRPQVCVFAEESACFEPIRSMTAVVYSGRLAPVVDGAD